MKMSKKICSLLLVLCVLCTAVPAFARTEVVNNGLLPEAGITMENVDIVITNNFFVCVTDETVLKALSNGLTTANRCAMEGSFTVGDETYTFTKRNINGCDNGNMPYLWVSTHFATISKFETAIEAAKDSIPGIELASDGKVNLSSNAGKRNVKRYFMTKLNMDYSALDENELENYTIPATGTVTIYDNQAGTQEVEVGNIPEGTLFLASSRISNDLPSTWQSLNGVYQQKTTDADVGIDGSWTVFTAPETGTYNVWATKRDRTTTNGTTADTGAHQRDIFVDVSGTKLSFDRAKKSDGSYYAPTNMAYYWEPELNGTTVNFTKGQKVYVRMLSGTGNYAGSYGFIFVPADQNVEPDNEMFGGTISSSYNDKDPIATNFATLTVKSTAPHTGSELVSKSVTVNGAAVTATERTAFAAFPRVRQYDMNGNYLATATVMDAVVAADAADDSYDLSKIDTKIAIDEALENLAVTVNGDPCLNPDRVAVNDGDVITVESIVVDKTNFKPLSLKGIITANGSVGTGDALKINGVADGCNSKLVAAGDARNLSDWRGIDITANDALADCYINGYITIGKDVSDTDGDDTKVIMFVKDMKILHSAIRSVTANGQPGDYRLELGIVSPNTARIKFDDGYTYISPNFPENGKLQEPKYTTYDLSHLYITNTKSAAATEVTATKTADGVYKLTTNKSLAVVLYRVAKDASGAITGVTTEYKILDFMGGGETVTVGDNETVYVWEGSFMKDVSSTSLKPLCAPLTK